MVQPLSHSPAVPSALTAVRLAISKKEEKYAPREVGIILRMETVGPTTNTKTARITARTMLPLDRYWMPLPTPDRAERMNARVRTETIPNTVHWLGSSMMPAAVRPAP